MKSVLLKNGTIITSTGSVEADVVIVGNTVKTILKRPYEPGLISPNDEKFEEEIDVSGKLLLPGLIDCHVHFREPGLEHKETMATGSAAALAGGITTVCDMPNTIPPTVTVEALAEKVRRAKESKIDMRFFFGATEPKHLDELKAIFTDPALSDLRRSCCGLKLYLDHSTGDQKAPRGVIEQAFKLGAELGIPVVCHCEDADMNEELRVKNNDSSVAAHSKVRPPESEAKSIEYALSLAKKHGTQFHVAHLSTQQGIALVRAAKKSGINVTCEVAPHHLFLTVDDYEVLGTLAKMNPPLRSREHQEALWQGISDGTVDCISTDHAPHTLEEKTSGDLLRAPSGVPGVETMLPLLLGKLSPAEILRLCFINPNRIFRLEKRGIAEGAPADLIIIDPKQEWSIRGKELRSKCGWTPFEGWKVQGRVVRVVKP